MQWVGADVPPLRTALPRAGLHGQESADLVAAGESEASEEWRRREVGGGLFAARWLRVGAAAPPSPRTALRRVGLRGMEAAGFGPPSGREEGGGAEGEAKGAKAGAKEEGKAGGGGPTNKKDGGGTEASKGEEAGERKQRCTGQGGGCVRLGGWKWRSSHERRRGPRLVQGSNRVASGKRVR